MHTRALLRRLADLRGLQESPAGSDWSEEDLATVSEAGLIAFRDTALWCQAFEETRALLGQREHIPRGGKEARRNAQQANQRR